MTPGEVLHGRFELLSPLGVGGVAAVWRARDRQSGETVALKVMHSHLSSDPVLRERFRREAGVLASLSHSSIVRAHGVFDDGAALSFSMEVIEGATLKDHLRVNGPLTLLEAGRIAREILAGLSAAHAAGVVHRDLNPRNILLDSKGGVRIVDFGFARVSAAAGLTTRSLVLCTPEYAAPEVIEGRPVDGRADLYALGVVLFEALTARQPFSGGTPFELLRKHLSEPAPSIHNVRPEAPQALDELITRLLAKRPEDRYSTADEVIEALDRPIPVAAVSEQSCPACGAPLDQAWPLCPSCGASEDTAVAGDWMVILSRAAADNEHAGRLRAIVRSVGGEPGHELSLANPDSLARPPRVILKNVSESLARLVRERCLAADLQVEIRRSTENNIDLLYRSAMPAFVFWGGATLLWLLAVGAAFEGWRARWHAEGSAFILPSIVLGLALAAGPAVRMLLTRNAHRFLPPLAVISTGTPRLPLPERIVDRYRRALASVREKSLRGTIRSLLSHTLGIQESARGAPDHLLDVLEPPRQAALDLLEEGLELATVAQGQLDAIDALPEQALWEEIASLRAKIERASGTKKSELLELLAAREAALGRAGELDHDHATTTHRLLRLVATMELAAVRMQVAAAPEPTLPGGDSEALARDSAIVLAAALELAGRAGQG